MGFEDATVPRIDCTLFQDLVEGYVVGQVGRAVATSVERHYFACAPCFDLLQSYRAAQVALQESRGSIRETRRRRPGLLAWLRGLGARLGT